MQEMSETKQRKRWGIIRYAPGSGTFCDDDAAAFDGWYSDHEDALEIARAWHASHYGWIVAVVCQDQVFYGGGDFTTVADRPLTRREKNFARIGEVDA